MLGAAVALACVAWFACASADGLPADPGASTHVLIGMLPGTGFEVTCDDSLLSDEPVPSDDLGLVWFTIDRRLHGAPSTVCIRVPAPPVITGQHVADLADTFAVIQWQTDRIAVSQVEFGPTAAYGQATPLSQHYTKNHSVTVGNLAPQAVYHYRAVSVDAFGHRTVAADGTLTTLEARPRMFDVAGQAMSPSTIRVSWRTTKPGDTRVEYGPDASYGGWSLLDPALTLEHAVVLEGLAQYTEYHFRAWSADEHGLSVNSGDRTATTPPQELQVLHVAVADTNSVTATIEWTTSNPATSLVEYGATGAYGHATAHDAELLTEHLVVLDDLTPDMLYHFRVRSTDEYAQEVSSPDATFETHPLGFPEALVIYVAGMSSLDWNSATVRWLTNLPANSTVEYGPTAAYGWTVSESSYGVRHEVVIPDLEENSLYHYRVVSTTEAGTTAATVDATFRTLPRPLEIVDLSVTGVTQTSFTVEWTTTRPATAQIEYGMTDLYGSITPVTPELSTQHSVTVPGLSPETEYHFRALSEDGALHQGSSPDSTVRTLPDGSSFMIEDIAVTDLGPSYATISWRTNRSASSVVEYGTTSSYGQTTALPDLVTEHAVALTGLAENTLYHYRVRSETGAGAEATSEDRTFSTPEVTDLMPPGTPNGLAAHSRPGGVTLTWEPNSEQDLAAYAVIRRSESEDAFREIARVPAHETRYTDGDAIPGLVYEYAVAAVDGSGNESGACAAVRAVAAADAAGGLWVFPNPARDAVSIRFAVVGQVTREGVPFAVAVHDAGGRLVKTVARGEADAGYGTVSWDVTDSAGRRVPSGVYFCTASFPSGECRTKVMIVR